MEIRLFLQYNKMNTHTLLSIVAIYRIILQKRLFLCNPNQFQKYIWKFSAKSLGNLAFFYLAIWRQFTR